MEPPDRELVLAQIRADAAARRFDDWAISTVIDENTGGPVIDPELFVALHAAAGLPATYPVGNAGVLHVYGYWFSTVVTPYGYKRDRWTDGQLARAFGLNPEAFLLTPATPTLLQRVTEVALPALRTPAPESTVGEVTADGLETRVTLARAAGAPATALVYGVRNGPDWRLVTTFPVVGNPAALLAEYEREPRLRWNAARG